MSKTYSIPKPETTNTERSWEQRWTKKFGTWQKPIRVPSQMIQGGIVDLPPVPSPDLSEWLPSAGTFAQRENDIPLTGIRLDEKKAADMLIDWKSAMDEVTRKYSVDAVFMDRYKIEPRPVSMRAYAQAYTGRTTSDKPNVRTLDREGTSVSSSYLHSVYDPAAFQRTVELIVEMMKPHLDSFDAIAFRGSSGAALAYPLGYLLKKPLIHIRKELGHSYSHVEGLIGAKRIAIIDDFVASGETIRIIHRELVAGYAERGYAAPVLAHLFLYAERCTSSEGQTRGAVGEILENCEIHIAYD